MSALDRGDNRREHVAELEDSHRPRELGFRLGELCIHFPLRLVAVEGRVRFFERLSKEREVGLQLRQFKNRLGHSSLRRLDSHG